MKCLVILILNVFINCLNQNLRSPNPTQYSSNSNNTILKVLNETGLIGETRKLINNTGSVLNNTKKALEQSLLSLYDFEYENELLWTQNNIIGVSIIIILNTLIFIIIIKETSSLFSKGLGRKYMNGGGWWLMLSAFIGMLFGCLVGVMMRYSMLILGFSFMLLSVSALLLGRIGMVVGGVAGLEIGSIFGTINSGSISRIIFEALLCCFAGVAIGFVPMFPNIKINARYIQRSLKNINSLESNLKI